MKANHLKIAVGICTWNRAELLDQTLQSFTKILVPGDMEWELIVVDNNSTDHTVQVVDKYRKNLPLHYVFEKKQGHSHARNRTVAVAQADWLIFTDDDVLVRPDWIAGYAAGISKLDPNVAFVGGEITPWFPVEPDPDLKSGIPMVGDGFCAREMPTNLAIENKEDYLPFGANFAIRLKIAKKLRFDPVLGLVGKNRVIGEEEEFMIEMLKLGYVGRWIEGVGVQHYVDPKRLEMPSLRRTCHHSGITHARRGFTFEGRFKIFSVPGWMYFELTKGFAYMLIPKRFFRDKVAYYSRFRERWFYFGYIRERIAIWLRSSKSKSAMKTNEKYG